MIRKCKQINQSLYNIVPLKEFGTGSQTVMYIGKDQKRPYFEHLMQELCFKSSSADFHRRIFNNSFPRTRYLSIFQTTSSNHYHSGTMYAL